MAKFSQGSADKLSTCHKDIQLILNELIKYYDFSVIEGHRSKETQMKYFAEGKSKLDGVSSLSKHQSLPSLAADIMPWASGTNAFSGNELDNRRFYMMMGMVKMISIKLLEEGKITHSVRFGLDWDGDYTFADQTFHDLPHLQLEAVYT